MTVEYFAFEMKTGRRLTPLPVTSGPWAVTSGADDSISVTIPARAKETRELGIWDAVSLARSGLLVVVDGNPVAAGPIWKRSYRQGTTIEVAAGGPRSYWERRLLLPVAARTTPIIDPETGDPDPSLDFAASGLSLGTIGKRYIELVQLWPDGELPLMLPPDIAGAHEDTVKATDLRTVRRLLDNLQQRQGGPDFAFVPRWASDGLGIYWEMQHGTEETPRLGNTDPSLIQWRVGARAGGAFDLEVEEDGTSLASEAFTAGGQGADRAVVARAFDSKLIDDGAPLLQVAQTGVTEATTAEEVQRYADQRVHLGGYAASFWKMNVRAHERGTPKLGDYWLGDLATVTIDPSEPVIPAGDYVRRIASIRGDERGQHYSLTFAEAVA